LHDESELSLDDGSAQPVLDPLPPVGFGPEGALVADDRARCCHLRASTRQERALDQIHPWVAVGPAGQAGAGTDHDLDALNRHGHTDLGQQSCCELAGGLDGAARHDDEEPVAVHHRGHCRGLERGQHTVGGDGQHTVARSMAVPRVDVVQAIEVEVHHCRALGLTLRAIERRQQLGPAHQASRRTNGVRPRLGRCCLGRRWQRDAGQGHAAPHIGRRDPRGEPLFAWGRAGAPPW
jgi:hypothetical protein